MAIRTLFLDDTLYGYLRQHGLREPDVLRRLRQETEKMPGAAMQIAPEEGQLLALLVELTGARRALEIGTYTGYSALWIALALPRDGRLLACDIDAEAAAIAQRYFDQAGVNGKVEMCIAPALHTLDAQIAEGQAGTFDFAFIDADKEAYATYYERCLMLLREGGLIAIDNAFWDGRVVDPDNTQRSTRSIRALSETIHRDPRVSMSLVPIGDGLLLARKRGRG